jgi:hypothetical protein
MDLCNGFVTPAEILIFVQSGKRGFKPQAGCEERPGSATGNWQVSFYV